MTASRFWSVSLVLFLAFSFITACEKTPVAPESSPDGLTPANANMMNSNGPFKAWQQGFQLGTEGWSDGDDSPGFGSIDQVDSGTDGIMSSAGRAHATVEGTASGPFSFFAGVADKWPNGGWTAELDVYLDPSWSAGEGFDYSVASAGTDGAHQRDFIFHVTKDNSTGKLLVAGSNNTNFAPRQDLENINHFEVTDAGWYTLRHVFRNDGGFLFVDMELVQNGQVLFTETRDPRAISTIPDEVGGNFYSWFTHVTGLTLPVDEHSLRRGN